MLLEGRLARRRPSRVGYRAGTVPGARHRVHASQLSPQQWAAMADAARRPTLRDLIVDALLRELDIKGTLNVLRHGFKFYGKTFHASPGSSRRTA